jgi:hypothetical protein
MKKYSSLMYLPVVVTHDEKDGSDINPDALVANVCNTARRIHKDGGIIEACMPLVDTQIEYDEEEEMRDDPLHVLHQVVDIAKRGKNLTPQQKSYLSLVVRVFKS